MKSRTESFQAGALPPLYARWIDDLLDGPIPAETRATCDDCVMCPKPGDTINPEDRFFEPSIKCCSIVPVLPNFLVGRILSGDDPDPVSLEGRASVERRIKEGVAVTPLGLEWPAMIKLLYDNSDAFGQSQTFRCPHYVEEAGRCGIWRHRDSVCATWFCKHVRGEVGRKFWRDSLEPLLRIVEKSLAQWCVLKMDIGGAALL